MATHGPKASDVGKQFKIAAKEGNLHVVQTRYAEVDDKNLIAGLSKAVANGRQDIVAEIIIRDAIHHRIPTWEYYGLLARSKDTEITGFLNAQLATLPEAEAVKYKKGVVLVEAAKKGDLVEVKTLSEKCSQEQQARALKEAAKAGHLDTTIFLADCLKGDGDALGVALKVAAKGKVAVGVSLKILDHLFQLSCPQGKVDAALTKAAEADQFETVQFLKPRVSGAEVISTAIRKTEKSKKPGPNAEKILSYLKK